MNDAIRMGLVWGAALSAFMGALIWASLKQNPLIWAGDAPPDVRARIGALDERTKRQKRSWGVVMVVGLVALFGSLAWRTFPLGLAPTFVAAFLCFQTFNLFDALVIDLGLVVLKPAWAFPPGTADSPSYRDVRWHLGNWLKGFAGGAVFAALVTGVSALARLAV